MEAVSGFAPGAWVVAIVLIWAGGAKLREPRSWDGALGAVEVAVGATVLLVGGALPTAAMAVLYAGFAAYSWRRLRTQAAAGCGCFGDEDAPLTLLHVVVDLVSVGVAVGAVLTGAPNLGVLTDAPLLGATTLGLVVLGAALVRQLLTSLPAVLELAAVEGGSS